MCQPYDPEETEDMTVKELIKQLRKIPGDYEVQIILNEMPPTPNAPLEEHWSSMQKIEAMSAYLYSANANHEEKLAYVFGVNASLPEKEKPFAAGKN